MDVNWKDETSTVQGTPVNRQNLMGMQGFAALTGSIEATSNGYKITETSSVFGVVETTIASGTARTTITKRFYPEGETTYTRVITALDPDGNGGYTITQTVGTYSGTYGG